MTLVALTGAGYATLLHANDWPQWLGPHGSNQVAGEGFKPDLSGYSVLWEKQIGLGYASITVVGNRAFAMGHDAEGKETVFCLDAASGKAIWQHSYGAELLPRMHKGGPNATPTVQGDRVYTLSKDGQLLCLNVANGDVHWQVNLIDVFQIKMPNWGFASSPVINDGRVFVSAGKVAALDAASGERLWVSATAQHPGYTTPVLFQHGSTEYVAALDGKGLSILTARDGTEVVRHPFKAQFDMLATTPVVLNEGRAIFISGNMSSELLAFDGADLSLRWRSRDIRNAMNNSVIKDKVIYGVDGKQGSRNARLVAVKLEDGKLLWSRDGFGYGNTIGVGDYILSLNESGELAVSGTGRDAYKEFSRRKVLDKTCWTTPVFAQDRIYIRNDQGHLVCLAGS